MAPPIVKGWPFANRHRTSRLLKLLTVHRRGDTTPAVWSRTIRDHVTSNGGITAQRLRTSTDPHGSPSLR